MFRTAGSHGIFDLIVLTKSGHAIGIQCKTTANQATAKQLISAFKNDPPMPRNSISQVLAIHVKGSPDWEEIWA